jgi:hypothetical protein
MLRLAGEGVIAEKVERITYQPGLQDSGDLEVGTKSIAATAKQAAADYETALAVAAPADARLEVLRLVIRLAVTIDGFGGAPPATQLSYAVEVNGVERLTGSWSTTGSQAAAVDLTPGQFLLGAGNGIKVYLWVNRGEATLSRCQLWLGVGSCSNVGWGQALLSLRHNGLLRLASFFAQVGGGSMTVAAVGHDNNPNGNLIKDSVGSGSAHVVVPLLLLEDRLYLRVGLSAASDIGALVAAVLNLRSEK